MSAAAMRARASSTGLVGVADQDSEIFTAPWLGNLISSNAGDRMRGMTSFKKNPASVTLNFTKTG